MKRLMLGCLILMSACFNFEAALADCRDAGRCELPDGGHFIPNVLLLVETSQRALLPLDPQHPQCPADCGRTADVPCPTSCPTRLSEVQAGVSAWLAASGGTVRTALVKYPSGPLCETSLEGMIPLPSPTVNDVGSQQLLEEKASEVARNLVQAVTFEGSPTTKAIENVARLASLSQDDQREDFIVLITYGEPNCLENNRNQLCACDPGLCGSCDSICQTQIDLCRCAFDDCSGRRCSIGCTDSSDMLRSAIRQAVGIKTVVIVMGMQRDSQSPYWLSSLAEAHRIIKVGVPGQLQGDLESLF